VIRWAIVDTGPLVALLDADDRHHSWAKEVFHSVQAPLLACEPAITEALFLLRALPEARDKVLEWIERGSLSLSFSLANEAAPVRALLRRYHDVPMSLADACLVRMAEMNDRHHILTLDSDFSVYRKNGREPLSLISP